MSRLFNDRFTVTIIILCAATLLSWYLGHGDGRFGWQGTVLTSLTAAAIKARLIIREFMEVREAPGILGAVTDIWVLSVSIGLAGLIIVGG